MANATPRPKNPKQSAKTKRASQEAAAAAKAKANSERLKLAARERKSPGRGAIPSGIRGVGMGGGGLRSNVTK